MSDNAPEHYAVQYSNNLQLLLQQKMAKLRPYAMEGHHVGKGASPVDQDGPLEAREPRGRYAPIGQDDAPKDRRWVNPRARVITQKVANQDEIRTFTNPRSKKVMNAVMGLNRAIDNELIRAFHGTNYVGEEGETARVFPAAQKIAHGNAHLTVSKLIQARKMLRRAELDMDSDPCCVVVNADQEAALLEDEKIINMDYRNKPILNGGMIEMFLNFHFIHCERTIKDSSGNDLVPIFAMSGMYLGVWNDINTDIGPRRDLEDIPWQANSKMTIGGTRLEEPKCVEVACTANA